MIDMSKIISEEAIREAAIGGAWMQNVKMALWTAHQEHGKTHFSGFIPDSVLDDILSKAYDDARKNMPRQ